MKKTKIVICVVILALCVACAFTACNKQEPEPEPVTKTVSTVEELIGIKDFLGKGFSHYTFKLEADLDLSGVDWEPLGSNLENAFCGDFDGNGHTISNLSVKGMDSFSGDYLKGVNSENGYVGLFGYVYNSEIKNLTLTNTNYDFYFEQDIGYFGGLAGYCYGKCNFDNVKLDGNLNIGSAYKTVMQNIPVAVCEQTQYIGGLIGYAIGDIDIANVDVSMSINNFKYTRGKDIDGNDVIVSAEYADYTYYPECSFVGGVAGFISGIVMADGDESTLNAVSFSGTGREIRVTGSSIYVGGLYATVNDCELSNGKEVGEDTVTVVEPKVFTKVSNRASIGGIVGLADKCTVKNVYSKGVVVTTSGYDCEAYNVGGITGYLTNGSVLQNSNSIDFRINTNSRKNDMGGISAIVRDSEVNFCKANGGGIYKNQGKDVFDDQNVTSGGIASSVVGNSSVKNCASSFLAYYGTVALYSENIYVNEDGKRILRFGRINNSKIFVGVYAEEVDENVAKRYIEYFADANKDEKDAYDLPSGEKSNKTVLFIHLYDESRKEIRCYYLTDYTKADNINATLVADTQGSEYLRQIEGFSLNYYDEENHRLVDGSGIALSVNGRVFDNYERKTGVPVFENMKYLTGTTAYTEVREIESAVSSIED